MRAACRVILWSLWAVLCASCSRGHQPVVRSTHLANFPFADIYPLANGSALAVAFEKRGAAVFLLSQNEARQSIECPRRFGRAGCLSTCGRIGVPTF
jgi:hypothetical protein